VHLRHKLVGKISGQEISNSSNLPSVNAASLFVIFTPSKLHIKAKQNHQSFLRRVEVECSISTTPPPDYPASLSKINQRGSKLAPHQTQTQLIAHCHFDLALAEQRARANKFENIHSIRTPKKWQLCLQSIHHGFPITTKHRPGRKCRPHCPCRRSGHTRRHGR
jgi:hypothetical protein